jgi:hypothetical protein
LPCRNTVKCSTTTKKGHTMLKRTIFLLLVALQFAAVTPVAKADLDFPQCYPCDDQK